MKWNIAYTIYEGIALLVILICLGAIVFTLLAAYQEQLEDLQMSMDKSLKITRTKHEMAIFSLENDVKINGNAQEGLERIRRAELLRKEVDKIDRYIKDIHGVLSKTNRAYPLMIKQGQEAKFKLKLNRFVEWLSVEFKDLHIPDFDHLTKENTQTCLANTTAIEARVWFTQKQLTIRRYEESVLQKLGAWQINASVLCGGCKGCLYLQTSMPTQVVEAGNEYTSDLFLMGNRLVRYPRFYTNSKRYPVEGYNRFAIETKGEGTQYWEAKFTYRDENDQHIEVIKQIPYRVIK